MKSLKRRDLLLALGSSALLTSCSSMKNLRGLGTHAHVVVVGAGFGGATCAKYLRLWSKGKVAVTMVEPNPTFISCPVSNQVLGGYHQMADITMSYQALRNAWGVEWAPTTAVGIDANAHTLRLADGTSLSYDRLVLAPGVDFLAGDTTALQSQEINEIAPHAWKAGSQTELLRRQLIAMPDGGLFVISIPTAPFRCPPGPYERACVVASYFKRAKPRAKVLILDANDKIQSKEGLFKKAFAELYGDMIEYRPSNPVHDVDLAQKHVMTDFDTVAADVLNLIPPQKAGAIAFDSGAHLINNRWVEVDWLTFASTNIPTIHVLGDAIFPAPLMPKSAHMANQQAKVTAAAIVNILADLQPNPQPVLMNTCYSFADDKSAFHVASVHQYNAKTRNYDPNPNMAGGLSMERSELEGRIAKEWAQSIWSDTLA